MRARIYQPAKTATQSGQAKTRTWGLEFAPDSPRFSDPLMGWTGSTDTQAQVRLTFETKEAAVEYADERGIEYVLLRSQSRAPNLRKMGYGENFSHIRRGAWTH
jgi:NADH dehydrogenase